MRRIESKIEELGRGIRNSNPSGVLPIGALLPYAGSSAPDGFLLCDGAEVSRTAYASLFAVIGTTYGAGNGTTTFGVPDLRGRVPVGVDGTANRLTANDALGQSGGAEKHTLTVDEMPSHAHVHEAIHYDAVSSFGAYQNQGFVHVGQNTAFTGGDQPHNNMPPFQIVNYIIKT